MWVGEITAIIQLPDMGPDGERELLALDGKLRVDPRLIATGVNSDPTPMRVKVDRIKRVDTKAGLRRIENRQALIAKAAWDTTGAQQCGQQVRLRIANPSPLAQNVRSGQRNNPILRVPGMRDVIPHERKCRSRNLLARLAG